MNIKEKATLSVGKDFWSLHPIASMNLPSIMMCDGPHGLRKQEDLVDHLGINKSKPATCFPAACAQAATWHRELIHQLGIALGEACVEEHISVLLGPGINIKRSPLCGRNFEYYSEDPYLTGQLSTAFVKGLQSKGVGASVKHFAMNNQEYRRMSIESIVDERTLREIYLSAFEMTVKTAQPWTIMSAYNQFEGKHCSENKRLLTDILRNEWGFQGAVISDWGACSHRVKALKAGMDIEMPYSGEKSAELIVEAIKNKTLTEEALNITSQRIVDLINKAQNKDQSKEIHDPHQLAKEIALEGAVLLKNDGVLPLDQTRKIGFVGDFFETPRIQGSGSSHVNPKQVVSSKTYMESLNYPFDYLKDFDETSLMAFADTHDTIVACIGLTDIYESEGFDRESLALPKEHNQLIQSLNTYHDQVVVVLFNGSPVTMPWLKNVSAVLTVHLGGEAVGEALIDLLYGSHNPSGKLAETYPLSLDDIPSTKYFKMGPQAVTYREGLYVGYRYFDTFNKPVCFPFGYGLSYTTFEYSKPEISSSRIHVKESVRVSVNITNTGAVAGSEVVQLYIHQQSPMVHRPKQELKDFQKIYLEPNETKKVVFHLSFRNFAYFDTELNDWYVAPDTYEIRLSQNINDVKEVLNVILEGPDYSRDLREIEPEYYADPSVVSDETFTHSMNRKFTQNKPLIKGDFNKYSTFSDIKHTLLGKYLYHKAYNEMKHNGSPIEKYDLSRATDETPLQAYQLMTNGKMSYKKLQFFINLLNGQFFF